jgi:hypothetical protein
VIIDPPTPFSSPPHIGDLRAGVSASIRIARRVRYPPIHSQIVIHSLWFSHIDVRGGCQLESLAVADQVALTLIERIGIHPLGDSPHGHLSGQVKAPLDSNIEQDQLTVNHLKGGGIRLGI